VRCGVESAGVEGGARSDKENGGGLVEACPVNETYHARVQIISCWMGRGRVETCPSNYRHQRGGQVDAASGNR